jgi:hypothetical protein
VLGDLESWEGTSIWVFGNLQFEFWGLDFGIWVFLACTVMAFVAELCDSRMVQCLLLSKSFERFSCAPELHYDPQHYGTPHEYEFRVPKIVMKHVLNKL